jgi:hypothetical protein
MATSSLRCRLASRAGRLLVVLVIAVWGSHAAGEQPRSGAVRTQSELRPDNLRCEYYGDPRGVDAAHPFLSWELVDSAATRGQGQLAYQVRVASEEKRLEKPDLWDSGRVESDQTLQVAYDGKALATAQRCYWQVRVWDRDGVPSAWSAAAAWTMGVLDLADWKAQWIGAEQGPGPRHRLGIGYHAAEAKSLDEAKWVQIDLGASVPVDRVVLWPVRNHLEYSTFGFPTRFTIEASDGATFEQRRMIADFTGQDFVCPVSGAVKVSPPVPVTARYVRVTATRLFPRKDGVGCFALAETEVESAGKTLGRGCKVSALDSVEQSGWTLQALTDGCGPSGHSTLLMRKEVIVPHPIRRATAFVCGLGQYEFTIDGHKIGNAWMTPGWTQYVKTCLYDTYDVTDILNVVTGSHRQHALGLRLGTGMYDMIDDTRGAQQQRGHGGLRAIAQIMIEYSDGTWGVIVTDPSWRWHDGPTTYSGVFGGEDYDARLEPAGWDKLGFDDTRWLGTVAVEPLRPWSGSRAPGGGEPVADSMEATMKLAGLSRGAPPLVLHEIRAPMATSTPRQNTLVFDLGQNAPYVPRITVKGRAGTMVQLWPAEIRKPDGTIDQTTMRAGKHVSYTCRGGGDEVYWPRFWYVGSRFWQATAKDATGKDIDPASVIEKFEGLMVYSDSTPVGTFECSDELFNKTRDLIAWAMRSNMASILTDCPHREKSGWLEQIHLNAPGLMYNFDVAPLFRKTMEDMGDAQQDDGMVPTMAPEYFIYDKGYRDSIEWGGACIYLPGYTARWYGDSTQVTRHYDQMSRYMAYLATLAKDNIISTGLGDWDGYGADKRTPVALTDTAYYYRAAVIMSVFAHQTGRDEDSAKWQSLAAAIGTAFNKQFLDAATGKYATGSQSCQATVLDMDLAPEDKRAAAEAWLLEDIEEQHLAISCGEVGHPSLLRALMREGWSDVIYRIHHQSERPGYGWQIAHGATTLTEAWDASPISQNHFMLGHIMEWFYAGLAGIRPGADGFRHFVIRPEPVEDIAWAKGSYRSIRGEIRSEWHQDGQRFSLRVTVPPNTQATVYVPAKSLDAVTENGRTAATAAGVMSAGMEAGRAVFEVGSGRYVFESR